MQGSSDPTSSEDGQSQLRAPQGEKHRAEPDGPECSSCPLLGEHMRKGPRVCEGRQRWEGEGCQRWEQWWDLS